MLKFIFWTLLAANAALFAYERGYLEAVFPSGREPARLSNQINADKIRLVPPGTRPVAPPPAPPAASASPAATPTASAQTASAPAAPAAPVAAAAAGAPATASAALMKVVEAGKTPAAPDKPALGCAEIGSFGAEDAKRFTAQLAPLALGERLSQRAVQETTHVVFIPSQGDKDGADRKAGELRRLGINDFFIIQDNSPLRWGISLGVFKTEEAARQHLANLNQKGVRTARLGQRSLASGAVAFRIKDLDGSTRSALEKIKAAFPRQDIRNCDAI